MKNLRIIVPLTLIAISLSFPVQPAKAYENTEFAFAIDPPSGWTEKYDPVFAPKSLMSFINYDSRVIYGNITEIFIYAESVPQSRAVSDFLGTYPDIVKGDIESNESAASVQSENIVKIGGLDCYEVVYTVFGEHWANKYKHAVFVQNGIAYDILFFGQDLESYNTYLPVFEQSLQTFRLTGTPSVTPRPPASLDEALSLPKGSFTAILFFVAIAVLAVSVAVAVRKKRLKRKTHAPSPTPTASGHFFINPFHCQSSVCDDLFRSS